MDDHHLQDLSASDATKEARPPCPVHKFEWVPRLFGWEVQRCKVCGFHLDSSARLRPQSNPEGKQ